MTRQRGHWLRPNKATVIPHHHLCIATITGPPTDALSGAPLYRAGIVHGEWVKGRWCAEEMMVCDNAAELWGQVADQLATDGSHWIWLMSPAVDLQSLAFTKLVEAGDFARDWWVWGDPPVILSGKLLGCKVRIVGVENWLGVAAADLVKVAPPVEFLESHVPGAPISYEEEARWETTRCAALVGGILQFVHREDLGHLCSTVGGQALQSYRHLHLRHKVLVDAHPDALVLERSCAIGFPVQMWRRGEVAGPIYVVDVNALYPWVMSQYPYPRKRVCYWRDCSIEQLRQAWPNHVFLARVSGEDDSRCYLVNRDRKCTYEHTLDHDTLCGPDFDSALTRGVIREVHEAVAYEAAPLFDEWGKWAWELRQGYKRRGDALGLAIAKALSVSLWGKFAGQLGRWEPAPDDAPREVKYGTFPWVQEDGTVRECRAIAGVVDTFEDTEEPGNSIPGISAFVACYARYHMTCLRTIAGEHNVIYQCADALHLNEAGFLALQGAGIIQPDTFGMLKLEQTVARAFYRGPNVYCHDNAWTCAGRPVAAKEVSPGHWVWESPERLTQAVLRSPTGCVQYHDYEVDLTKEVKHVSEEPS